MTEPLTALFVTAGEHVCALPLSHVREVMRPQPIECIPSSLAFVRGVAMIRGEPTPVIDLGLLLGDADGIDPDRFVTLAIGARTVAVAVSSVRAVRTLDGRAFTELPPLLQDADSQHVERLGRLDAELVLVLQAARLAPDACWPELGRRDAG